MYVRHCNSDVPPINFRFIVLLLTRVVDYMPNMLYRGASELYTPASSLWAGRGEGREEDKRRKMRVQTYQLSLILHSASTQFILVLCSTQFILFLWRSHSQWFQVGSLLK